MGKERFLKELGLPWEVAEIREAKSESVGGGSENGEKKPSPPDEEKGDTPEAELEAPQLTEESADHPAEQPSDKKPATKLGKQHVEAEEGQAAPAQIVGVNAEAEAEELAKATEDAGDDAAPESTPVLGDKATGELESERATLAAATIFLLDLLRTQKAWVWAVVLIFIAIAIYFLLKWYSGRGESTSLPKEASQTSSGDPVRDFLVAY